MTVILVERGPLAGRRFSVAEEVVIGRAEATIRLQDDEEVSRRHAVLRPAAGGGVEIEDLGSTNGTWVNERRLDGRVVARPGDTVRVGSTLLRIEAPAGVASARGPAVEAVAPPPAPPQRSAFALGGGEVPRRRRVASRSIAMATITFFVIGATAVALVVTFATRS